MSQKQRLDQLLVKKGLVESRETAQRLILAGEVMIGQIPASKPGQMVREDADVRVAQGMKYTSRGGLKLEAALAEFKINVQDKVIIDVGASTGGFTDCVLQQGAQKVYCVDVGYGQLSWRLRRHDRVKVMERTNSRYLKKEQFAETIDLAVIDVSFIGANKILEPLQQITGEAVLLLKPQFEAGPADVPKGGIIRDPTIHRRVLLEFFEHLQGWHVRGLIESPILGGSGNKEFLVHLHRDSGWTEEQYLIRVQELVIK